jgi:hypothetical protein
MMDSWKEARTVFIYKKRDCEDVENWMPITTTNSLYWIDTCPMARAFQQINTQHRLYVDAQKGFTNKTNGCSEHGLLLNELFQDAKTKRNDLIMTAVDFSNAFVLFQTI